MKAGVPARCADRGGRSGRWRVQLAAMRGDRGVAMVEFALIMIPFFVILFGIFEVGLVFWGSYELENATEEAARQIRTGQIQGGGGVTAFKQQVCNRVVLLSRCNTDLRVIVRNFSDYQDAYTQAEPLDEKGALKGDVFDPGGPRSIVLVSTYYRWPLLNAITSFSLSNMADGARLLTASAAFRNEPFP